MNSPILSRFKLWREPMNERKRKRLKAAGWSVSTVKKFLRLDATDLAYIRAARRARRDYDRHGGIPLDVVIEKARRG